jgi:hypothetical protein
MSYVHRDVSLRLLTSLSYVLVGWIGEQVLRRSTPYWLPKGARLRTRVLLAVAATAAGVWATEHAVEWDGNTSPRT